MSESRFFYVRSDVVAKSLAIKLSESKPNEIVCLTEEEMKVLLERKKFIQLDFNIQDINGS